MKKLNKNRALCLLSDVCILVILISMVLTGNNWNCSRSESLLLQFIVHEYAVRAVFLDCGR